MKKMLAMEVNSYSYYDPNITFSTYEYDENAEGYNEENDGDGIFYMYLIRNKEELIKFIKSLMPETGDHSYEFFSLMDQNEDITNEIIKENLDKALKIIEDDPKAVSNYIENFMFLETLIENRCYYGLNEDSNEPSKGFVNNKWGDISKYFLEPLRFKEFVYSFYVARDYEVVADLFKGVEEKSVADSIYLRKQKKIDDRLKEITEDIKCLNRQIDSLMKESMKLSKERDTLEWNYKNKLNNSK